MRRHIQLPGSRVPKNSTPNDVDAQPRPVAAAPARPRPAAIVPAAALAGLPIDDDEPITIAVDAGANDEPAAPTAAVAADEIFMPVRPATAAETVRSTVEQVAALIDDRPVSRPMPAFEPAAPREEDAPAPASSTRGGSTAVARASGPVRPSFMLPGPATVTPSPTFAPPGTSPAPSPTFAPPGSTPTRPFSRPRSAAHAAAEGGVVRPTSVVAPSELFKPPTWAAAEPGQPEARARAASGLVNQAAEPGQPERRERVGSGLFRAAEPEGRGDSKSSAAALAAFDPLADTQTTGAATSRAAAAPVGSLMASLAEELEPVTTSVPRTPSAVISPGAMVSPLVIRPASRPQAQARPEEDDDEPEVTREVYATEVMLSAVSRSGSAPLPRASAQESRAAVTVEDEAAIDVDEPAPPQAAGDDTPTTLMAVPDRAAPASVRPAAAAEVDEAPTLLFAPPPDEPAPAPAKAAAADDGDDPLIGLVIDERYRLEKVIGSGGMSRVYQAGHVRSGGKLAIKIIELHLSHKPEMMKRSVQETRAMMEIQSNYVVRAHDVGTFPTGQLYVVMELLAGETLEQVVKRDGPIPWPRLAAMSVQICNGLTAGHKRGIFHRDIKPQNCMRIDLDGDVDHIKLIDFGLARDVNGDAGVTQEGIILGTPEYMAPELIASRATPDARSDVYALGATMFKLMTGEAVFHEKSALDTLFHHKHTPPRPPSQVAPQLEIPEVADQIVLRALAKDPAARYASSEEMAQELRVALGRPRSNLPETSGGHLAAGVRERPVTPAPIDVNAVIAGAAGLTAAPIVTPEAVTPELARATAAPTSTAEPALVPTPSPVPAARREPAPSEPPARAEARPVPWLRVLLVLLALGLVGVLAVALTSTQEPATDGPNVAANVRPAAPTEQPAKQSVVAPAVAPADEPKDEPKDEPADDGGADEPGEPGEPGEPPAPAEQGEAAKPAVADRKVPEPGFDYRSARKYIEEQHGFLRQTCMKKGARPATQLKFRVEVRPNGRARVEMPGDASVRACVRSALAFVFDASPRGGAFQYTLTGSSAKLDRRPL